ncbi:MAG: hypothetical protein KDA37_01240, partial [Planctomycetales bacterium]|nr:hypothetical protein [Planctomycetales bacterium]
MRVLQKEIIDPPGASEADVSQLAQLLFRHWRKILLTPLCFLALGAGVILFAPRTYMSEAKILLRVGRESVGIDPTATTGNVMTLQQSGRDTEVQSALDLLQSRGLAQRVVEAVGVDYVLRGGPEGSGKPSPVRDAVMAPLLMAVDYVKSLDEISDKEEAIIQFGKSLKVDAEHNSTVIVISYETDSAIGAQAILDELVKLYQEEYIRLFRNPESREFFAKQKELLEQQVDDAEKRLRDAKNRMGLASIEGRRSTYEAQLSSIELAHYQAEQEYTQAEASVADLEGSLADLPERQVSSETSVPNAGADLLREQLYALQVKQIDLKARYSDDHPLVQAVGNQVAEAKRIVDGLKANRQETVNDVNPVHRELSLMLKKQETSAAGLSARLKTLEEQKRLVMADLKQLNNYEVDVNELQREVRLAEDKFLAYSNDFEQARIDEARE